MAVTARPAPSVPSRNRLGPVAVPERGRAGASRPQQWPCDRQARPAAVLVPPVPTTLYSVRVPVPAQAQGRAVPILGPPAAPGMSLLANHPLSRSSGPPLGCRPCFLWLSSPAGL